MVTPADKGLAGRVAIRWNKWLGGELGTPDYFTADSERALRRWRSYERRHPKAKGTREERILDLAKGLADPVEPDLWNKSDATDLAEALAGVINPPKENS